MSYSIPKIDDSLQPAPDSAFWDRVPEAAIACWPWGCPEAPPVAFARAVWNRNGLYFLLEAEEKDPRRTVRRFCGPVCTDSCLEVFFLPVPDSDPRYLNLEANALGTSYMNLRTCRNDPEVFAEPPQGIRVLPRLLPDRWQVQFSVSSAFLASCFPSFAPATGMRMRGNFYKCGDDTEMPHWGCWAWVNAPQPDFHRPECFADWQLAGDL